jgi:diguanylate cyclase (GGDEF)-like protein/PAS domain S-box-containing protein
MWFGALAVAAVVGSLSIVYQQRYAASIAAIGETTRVQGGINEALSLLKDAETGQRGFVLTGDRAFLVPYDHARQELPPTWERLERLVRLDPAQAASERRLRELADRKLAELEETIALRESARTDEALGVVREGQGRRFMVAIRAEAAQMLRRENERFGAREEAAKLRQRELLVVLAGVWGLLLCLVGVGIWSATRDAALAKAVNVRLKKSEQALRNVADNATDLVRIIGDRAELLYVSPSCEKVLGFSRAEMLAMGPRELLPDDEKDGARSLTASVRAGKADNKPFVHRLLTKSGAYRWFETTYCLVQEGDEQTAHVHLTSRDITERRSFEQALRRQTARLESILASMGDGVVVLDEHRNFLIVNPAATAYIHQDVGETAPTDWAGRHRTYLPDGMTPFPSEQGPLSLALTGKSSDGVELVIQDRGGMLRSFSVTARPILDGDKLAGCVAVYRDITDQRRVQAQVQESEERLRVLSESSFEGIAITKAGVILDVNENFASWVGRTRDDLVGTTGLPLFAAEDRERVTANSSSAGVAYEANLLRPDGSRVPVEVRGRFVTFRGEQVRIAVIRDVTEKRHREAELREQAELLRSMSLRDDLTGLYNRRGFLEHAGVALRGAVRTREPAAVFFADLNEMKAINDTFGHDAGDRAIVGTARVLGAVFRDSDIVARLGGDEFAIFAPRCGEKDVPRVRERLHTLLEGANQKTEEPFSLSISMGASVFLPGDPADLGALMESADRAMYGEKRARTSASGSNNVGSGTS